MLTLNGTTQYAYWDAHAAPIQGNVNHNELGGVNGFPLWVCFDFKPAGSGSWWALALQDQFGTARYAAQLAGSTIQFNDGTAGRSPHAGVQANVWQRVLIYRPDRAVTMTYLDGDAAATDAGDSPWSGGNLMTLGARQEGGNPADLYFGGSFANVAIGNAILTAGQRTGCLVGVNPLSLPGVVRYWPLKADALDAFGAWPLTLVNAPTITAVAHPDVDAWPPAAASSFKQQPGMGGGFAG